MKRQRYLLFLICPAAALLKQTHLQTCKKPKRKQKMRLKLSQGQDLKSGQFKTLHLGFIF